MNKGKVGRKFSRTKGVREAMVHSLARSLFLSGRIRTTLARAKELSRVAEKMITRAKTNNVSVQREFGALFDEKTATMLIKTLGPKYNARKGGYTRVIKLGQRKSDASPTAIIELV